MPCFEDSFDAFAVCQGAEIPHEWQKCADIRITSKSQEAVSFDSTKSYPLKTQLEISIKPNTEFKLDSQDSIALECAPASETAEWTVFTKPPVAVKDIVCTPTHGQGAPSGTVNNDHKNKQT